LRDLLLLLLLSFTALSANISLQQLHSLAILCLAHAAVQHEPAAQCCRQQRTAVSRDNNKTSQLSKLRRLQVLAAIHKQHSSYSQHNTSHC
jgi:hypothetical protein